MCSADFLGYDYMQMLSGLGEASGAISPKGRLEHARVSLQGAQG
jgi:hypothetical protein